MLIGLRGLEGVENGGGHRSPPHVRPVAVIDIGATSIRMAIAELHESGEVHLLSTLSQAVHLGRDVFSKGVIDKATIEECVRVLRSYRRVLAEYELSRPDQIRVVATSAVRESMNKLAFQDRIYTATGLQVEVIDEAEVSRITYLGVQPLLKSDKQFAEWGTLVVEVGGGSTEILVLQNCDVQFSQTYRLGSLRLRETIEAYQSSRVTIRHILETQMRRVIEQVSQHVNRSEIRNMVALGGDMRFAAHQLGGEVGHDGMLRLKVNELEQLTNTILDLNEDKIVHKYHISFPDAGTLGPALLAYVQMAKSFQLDEIHVANVNLRDGMLTDMASHGALNEDFRNQVVRSAIELGRKFNFAEAHARHVAKLCKILFQGLREEHHLEPRFELLLTVAALLHEIGLYIGPSGYHKHSMYLILNSELFGLSRTDVMLIGLTARYHRKTSPKPTHTGFTQLDRDQRIAVVKMAALLRLADALDASHSQRLHELWFAREGSRLVISLPQVEDLALEQLALKQTGALFEETYGMSVLLRKLRQ
ncbi:Exopolyphosphatase [Planctopirus ephydatiae]|jgi:exopolyphosphatase/guanosine-5'-triphosphate,3'-diphosphate pyrophosphatase|uniref:Exopolyphosphatase n=1 Tax=Planctopirus ephydatiae TaxID=2528019 RepID=A0A518GRM9_9PLAN|nr:HD domain-containing protein [Planctopirus ephydatiae]QDV31242.1 Exopolyphosphatase [Planctopirus ephydatiae]